MRPVFHHAEERIKSHVFICMLSYYLLWHLRQKLGQRLNDEYTVEQILETMKARQEVTLTVRGIVSTAIAAPTTKQAAIIATVSA